MTIKLIILNNLRQQLNLSFYFEIGLHLLRVISEGSCDAENSALHYSNKKNLIQKLF